MEGSCSRLRLIGPQQRPGAGAVVVRNGTGGGRPGRPGGTGQAPDGCRWGSPSWSTAPGPEMAVGFRSVSSAPPTAQGREVPRKSPRRGARRAARGSGPVERSATGPGGCGPGGEQSCHPRRVPSSFWSLSLFFTCSPALISGRRRRTARLSMARQPAPYGSRTPPRRSASTRFWTKRHGTMP